MLSAEGRKEAAFRDAEARERLAEAEANATRSVAEAATGAGTDALRYFIADKYVKAFEVLAGNNAQKLVIVPMESSALAGGITQAMELLRGPDGTAPPRLPPRPPAASPMPEAPSPWTPR